RPPNWLQPLKSLETRIKEMGRWLAVSKSAVADLRRLFQPFSERYKQESKAGLRPVEPPRQGRCKYCGERVTWATAEKRKYVPLVEAKAHGNYEIIGKFAVPAEGGPWRLHFFSCPKRPKSDAVSEEPILD